MLLEAKLFLLEVEDALLLVEEALLLLLETLLDKVVVVVMPELELLVAPVVGLVVDGSVDPSN